MANQVKTELNLTDTEWRILEHRLQVPDAIADTLQDDGIAHPTDVHIIAELLQVGDWRAADAHSERITQEVLFDAAEGCTWLGAMKATESAQAIRAHDRAYESLCDKLEARYPHARRIQRV